MDFIVLAAIGLVIFPRAEVTKECSNELYWAGIGICIYNLFFVVRNLFVCATSYFTKSPVYTSTLIRLGFICIDCIAYSAIVVWATIQVSSDSAMQCSSAIDEVDEFWWMVLVMIVIGYIQMFVEWLICLVSSCLLCFFCCFYFGSRLEEREDAI